MKTMFLFLFLFGILVLCLVGSAGNCGQPQIFHNEKTNEYIFGFGPGPCWVRGVFTTLSFVIGGLTSIFCGWIGMKIAV